MIQNNPHNSHISPYSISFSKKDCNSEVSSEGQKVTVTETGATFLPLPVACTQTPIC